ncbi:hypothetical protein GCM10010470_44040 [Saccharopolyspora taberi]|uniref:Uncharacterized protein n=1 Tax=Saccharopolyspora taberi TaxID=60895 RepID=A0ABN3VGU6_9PSEU
MTASAEVESYRHPAPDGTDRHTGQRDETGGGSGDPRALPAIRTPAAPVAAPSAIPCAAREHPVIAASLSTISEAAAALLPARGKRARLSALHPLLPMGEQFVFFSAWAP